MAIRSFTAGFAIRTLLLTAVLYVSLLQSAWVLAEPGSSERPAAGSGNGSQAAAQDHWAFQVPERRPLPETHSNDWARNRVDQFVLQRLEQAELQPNEAADRRTLIRRVTFDLIGLPPTPEEVAAFVADSSPHAYEQLVDRLLSSPHFGERWARLWLDIARYAEDQAHIVGDDRSLTYPNAYLYRDWIINAFNDDLPYDQFVMDQLAADLMHPDSQDRHAALGFLGLGPKYYRRNSPEVMADEWEDRVDTVTRGLMGLTVACARCHDHKFDPIPTEDYYALAGVFASTEMVNQPLTADVELDEKKQTKEPDDAMHIVREGAAKDLHVFIRGDVNSEGELVPRRFLTALSRDDPVRFERGSGRLELAQAITDRENPLTARVFVNRIWGQVFGKPLVGTPSNFGSLGEEPTHPELLDDLSVRFVEAGWSVKWLLRELVSSATYRQSSLSSPEKLQRDPENQLLSRMHRRRLAVEPWRDAVLAVSGQLERSLGGKSIEPQDPAERRRTVYSEASRLQLNPMLAVFDYPDPNTHSERRVPTTTPLQKLFVLNSPFMVQQAGAFARRLQHADLPDNAARIHLGYRLAFSREPTDEELRLAEQFLTAGGETDAVWEQYAQILLATNEMLIID